MQLWWNRKSKTCLRWENVAKLVPILKGTTWPQDASGTWEVAICGCPSDDEPVAHCPDCAATQCPDCGAWREPFTLVLITTTDARALRLAKRFYVRCQCYELVEAGHFGQHICGKPRRLRQKLLASFVNGTFFKHERKEVS